MSALRLVGLVLVVSCAGCYQLHGRSDGAAPDAAAARDASVDASADAGRLCGCPGSPTAHVCVLPLMCCPTTRTCEDPAHFNCSGSALPCE